MKLEFNHLTLQWLKQKKNKNEDVNKDFMKFFKQVNLIIPLLDVIKHNLHHPKILKILYKTKRVTKTTTLKGG